jgi:hypothetical protein
MKLKVLFSVGVGTLVAVLATLSPGTGAAYTNAPVVRLTAAVAPSQQPQAPAATPQGPAATPQPQAVAGQDTAVPRISQRWHRRALHLPRPPRSGNPSPQPSQTPVPAQAGVSCTLQVPASPLSADGLATAWQLAGGSAGTCRESNPDDSAFVEAAILDPATGQVSVYDPLVVDRGSRPAIVPTKPALPAGAVVGVWVGFNGNDLTLRGPGSDSCISGVEDSDFGQNAFCNATAFFNAANQAMRAGKLVPPALGTGKDGKPCPTTRDFSVVDQDQSDNTTTSYLVTSGGRLAQDTPANVAKLKGAAVAHNGSDEGLLDRAIDKALGCTPWTVPDLTDATGQQRSTAWPLNELMALKLQQPPVALVPAGDPFVFVGDHPSLAKLNAYRAGIDQPAVSSLSQADTKTYCRSLLRVGLPRIAEDRQYTEAAASPFPADASNLFNFLALRFSKSFSNDDGFLHCEHLLGVQNPVKLVMSKGVVVGAKIKLDPGPAAGPPQPNDASNQ